MANRPSNMDKGAFMTCASPQTIPISSSEYVAVDQGNSAPRFIRLSTYSMPFSHDLASGCHLPVAAMIQPFAQQPDNEAPVPVVDFGEAGPPRSSPPRLLSSNNDPVASPSRTTFLPNLQQPPPPSRKPESLHILFGIDVSAESVTSGLAHAICTILRHTIFANPDVSSKNIGIVAYDAKSVYFFDLSPNLSQPKMLVVSDMESMFVPLRTGLFVDPYLSRNLIEGLLDMIPTYFISAISGGAALGAVVQAGLSALLPTGGEILLFQRSHPSDLPERSKPDQELASTDKERTLFVPGSLKWTELAEECAEAGIAVNTWLFPSQFADVATINALSLKTGGDIYFHPRFLPERDQAVVGSEVSRVLTRPMGYNCTMRVRCSTGLSVSTNLGAFHQMSPSDLTIASSHADNSVLVTFTHSGRLDDRREAHIQSATLYTSRTGERRVRVLNIAVQVSTLAANIFKNADLEVVCCTFTREEALQMMSQRSLTEIRDSISEKCAALLLAYRRNCAASTSPTQLILPEAFKTLPVYVLGLLKSRPLKGSNVITDVRNYHAERLISISTSATMRYLYPRMTAIHDLSPNVGFPSEQTGRLVLPSPMPSSYTHMEPHGVYMIENGEDMYIWVGDGVSPQILLDLFNVENWDEIGPRTASLSVQVRNLITHGNLLRGRALPLHVVRQNMDGAEIEFSNLLVEDTNNDAMSYVDYLCYEHKQINQALVNGTNIGSNGWRIPW
ncbi:Sec23/Sec24 trunk domain [Rhizoctonia solani]|uniref:Sec23/Sec24 trunk domain n=1 Tax=Rhizoctonia solani TaxID=456999 RepID=A0A8H7MAA0_9AGAM|nr:Sec23/Sec24 trunk domain [Rhizoctonia solani]